MPNGKDKALPKNLYHGYGFGSGPEQREWALRGGGTKTMIDSANKDYAREQARKAGAYKKTGKSHSSLDQ